MKKQNKLFLILFGIFVISAVAFSIVASTISGGNGNVSLSVYAKNGDTVLRTDGGFRPEKTGMWQIVYTAVDYVGNSKIIGYDWLPCRRSHSNPHT